MSQLVSFTKLLALLVAMMFAAPAAHALDSGDIFVVSAHGEVRVTMSGSVRAVRAGSVLELPASVRTGRDGGIELRQGATTVSVGPDTVLEFPALERRGGPIDRIQQPSGNAFYSIGKRDGRKLRVETPYLVGVVKGTQFNVAAQADSTTISLFEGRLEVRAIDDSSVVDLAAGEIAALRRGEKSISVIPMDSAKVPATPPRVQGGEDGSNASHGPPRGDGPAGPVVGRNGEGVATIIEIERAGADLPSNTAVNAAPVSADVGVSASVDVASGSATADLSLAASPVAVDAGAGVGLDAVPSGVTTDVGAAVDIVAGAVEVEASAATAIDVGAGGVGVDVSTSTAVDAGPISAAIDAGAAVDAGANGIGADITAGTTIDAGAITAEVDTGAALDVGTGNVGADVTAATAIDAGAITTEVDTGAAVDVGAGGIGAGVDAGAAVGAGPVTADLNTSTGVDVGTGGTITVDTAADLGVATTTPVDVSVGVSAGVDVSQGTVDIGVSVGGLDLGLNVDLGLGGSEPATNTESTTPPATDTGNTGTTDLGGLLDGLLRRPGRR